jgi:sugar lactone lactonase YvrE
MLAITFTGLPAGTSGKVHFTSPIDGQNFEATANETRTVMGGPYQVEASPVAVAHPLIRSAYAGTADRASYCVKPGKVTTATITYALIPSSGKLWVDNSLKDALMVGYAPAALGASGAPAATAAAKTTGGDGFTFDRKGNLWVLGATTADPPLARYPAGVLGTSGAKTADVTITSPSFGGGSPGPKVVAFDRNGNLWVSVVWADKVVRFTPGQIARSGNPTPAIERTGINGPSGIVFDIGGRMFVASAADKKILRIDANHLEGPGSAVDLAISAQTPPPVTVDLPDPEGLAFDTDGHLWANFGGTLVRFTPGDLDGTGEKTVVPAIQIKTDVTALPHGIAFDEGGGLWVASSQGKFVRLGPTQLTSSGTKTPEVTIAGPDIGYAGWFALFPAPASLGLYHSL